MITTEPSDSYSEPRLDRMLEEHFDCYDGMIGNHMLVGDVKHVYKSISLVCFKSDMTRDEFFMYVSGYIAGVLAEQFSKTPKRRLFYRRRPLFSEEHVRDAVTRRFSMRYVVTP